MAGDDHERLTMLRNLAVLDTAPEEAFDEIVRIASMACRAPMAAVSLIDEHRQWFKAHMGLGVSATPRDVSFCDHAIRGSAIMIVPDALDDPRFATNALVTGDPRIRFYAGAIIRVDGVAIGALCVLDTVPRPEGLTAEQAELLQLLADQTAKQLRLRRVAMLHADRVANQVVTIAAGLGREDRLVRALQSGAVGWWEWDVAHNVVIGNPDLARDFALDPAVASSGAPLEVFFATVHPLDRPALEAAVKEAIETGDPFREEYRLLHPDGTIVWVSARGRCLRDEAGNASFFPGVIIDVSDRKTAEQNLRETTLRRELAMSAADLGSWDHDLLRGVRHYDARALKMIGITAAESADIANTYAVIHPDDRDRIGAAMKASVEPARTGPFREVFRVVDRATGETRWLSAVGRTAFENGICTRFIGVLADVTEDKLADEHRRMLTKELEHRVKNMLTVASVIVDASIREAEDLGAARRNVSNRLTSLSTAHDLLTAQSWISAKITAVIRNATNALSLPEDRIEIDGTDIELPPRAALQLALAFHELGTNAIKYGAFSTDTGRVRIAWALDGTDALTLTWTERGGPPVVTPTRRGFGSRLIERATAAEFRGTSVIDYLPGGVRWTLAGSIGETL